MRHHIDKLETRHLVTAIAGVFAMVSVQNVSQFFVDMGHHVWPSWTLGLAIGTVLVILAHLLAEVDMRERRAFGGLLTVTTILVTLSTFVQGMEYAPRMAVRGLPYWTGYLLAAVIVSTGEIVLPLAHSWFKEAQRRQAVLTAGSRAEEIAAETLVKTLSGLDLSSARRKAETRLGQLVALHVDKIVHDLAPDLDMSETEPRTQPRSSETSVQTMQADTGQGEGTPDEVFQTIMDNDLSGLPVADAKKQIADLFGYSPKTAERRLQKLERDGRLSLNGHVQVNK